MPKAIPPNSIDIRTPDKYSPPKVGDAADDGVKVGTVSLSVVDVLLTVVLTVPQTVRRPCKVPSRLSSLRSAVWFVRSKLLRRQYNRSLGWEHRHTNRHIEDMRLGMYPCTRT